MRFWDSSAIVPLLVAETHSAAVRGIAEGDPGLVLWWATPVECASAIQRLRRGGAFDRTAVDSAAAALARLAVVAHQVLPTEPLRRRAIRLTSVHPLCAADALQLAAALAWCRDAPAAAGFVCLDRRLREAAAREGFRPLPP